MKLRPILITLAGAALVALAIVLLSGGSSGYQMHAVLADADGLLTGSRVEIGGVGVGSVQSLDITPHDQALVTFTIDKQDLPVGRDASLVVRPADLLGEKYIDLSVGDRSRPAPSGYTIPVNRTQEATDFDQLVDVLGPTERDRLAILIHEAGVALFGRGANVAQLLAAAPPSLSDARQLIGEVNASNAQLVGLLDHAQPVLDTLTAHQRALTHFVATGAGALAATAAHTQGLQASIAEAPGLLSQLDTTLVSLDRAGANLRPAARGLENTAPGLTAALGALPGFASAAQPTLAEIRSLSPRLISLGHQSAPVIARLEPTMQKLQTLAVASNPVTASLSGGIDNLLGTLQNWARAIQTADGASHQFRVSVSVPPQFIKELLPMILGNGPSPANRPKPAVHRGASPSQTLSHAASTVSKTTSTLGGTVHKVIGGLQGTLGSVSSSLGLGGHGGAGAARTSTTPTPTTTSSLSNLLGYLTGGGR